MRHHGCGTASGPAAAAVTCTLCCALVSGPGKRSAHGCRHRPPDSPGVPRCMRPAFPRAQQLLSLGSSTPPALEIEPPRPHATPHPHPALSPATLLPRALTHQVQQGHVQRVQAKAAWPPCAASPAPVAAPAQLAGPPNPRRWLGQGRAGGKGVQWGRAQPSPSVQCHCFPLAATEAATLGTAETVTACQPTRLLQAVLCSALLAARCARLLAALLGRAALCGRAALLCLVLLLLFLGGRKEGVQGTWWEHWLWGAAPASQAHAPATVLPPPL